MVMMVWLDVVCSGLILFQSNMMALGGWVDFSRRY